MPRRATSTSFKPISIVDRFWNCVRCTDSCWLWTGYRDAKNGYGVITVTNDGGTRTYHRAHRFSYEIHKGAIASGLLVCHRCDVPACVNPDHLFLGTARDNRQDCISKGRARYFRGKRA